MFEFHNRGKMKSVTAQILNVKLFVAEGRLSGKKC